MVSVLFTTRTTGCGTGIELEKNTFCDISEGSLAGRGIIHFFEIEELRSILQEVGFQNVVIDTLMFTDRGNVVEQFLVQAES